MMILGFPVFWGWLGFGLALIALEVLAAPGTYLLWIGIAALMMAALSTLVTFSAGVELAVFGLLSLASGLIGWKIYGARSKDNDAARDLHDPATTFIGRKLVLTAAISGGIGQAKVEDSVWRVAGPDLPAGTLVRVVGLDGATLVVEAA